MSANEDTKDEPKPGLSGADRILVAGVIAAVAAYGGFIYLMFGDTKDFGPGTFGDSFGALNALFTGLAFALVFASLRAQREELMVTHKTLELTQDELKSLTDEFGRQREIDEENLRMKVNQGAPNLEFTLVHAGEENRLQIRSREKYGPIHLLAFNPAHPKGNWLKTRGGDFKKRWTKCWNKRDTSPYIRSPSDTSALLIRT